MINLSVLLKTNLSLFIFRIKIKNGKSTNVLIFIVKILYYIINGT